MNISGLKAEQTLAGSEKGAAQAIGTQKEQLIRADHSLTETRDSNAAGRAQRAEKNAKAEFKAAQAAAQRDVNFAETSQMANAVTTGLNTAANVLKGLFG
jgi:hypothetical protein